MRKLQRGLALRLWRYRLELLFAACVLFPLMLIQSGAIAPRWFEGESAGKPASTGKPSAPPNTEPCYFAGRTIPPEQTVTAYREPVVAQGVLCAVEMRRCINGKLSGSHQYPTCASQPYRDCQWAYQKVPHNVTVTAYRQASVAAGQSCDSENRTCNDGSLSGSYAYSACSVLPLPAAGCIFNGQRVAHDTHVVAYSAFWEPAGSSCRAERRYCNNGVLFGTYQHSSCTVGTSATPRSCFFDARVVPHGGTVRAYRSASVDPGRVCESETRTCTDGTLAGRYTFPSCSESPATSAAPLRMLMPFVNNTGHTVRMMFQRYSGQIIRTAPIDIPSGASQTIEVTCTPPEQVCFGGEIPGLNRHFGQGPRFNSVCDGCCRSCAQGTVQGVTLR